MKAKNQPHITSEIDAKERLISYVYEYLVHAGAKQAADTFKETIGYNKDIPVNEGPGFLLEWWCLFWDIYCAAPERRQQPPESSSEARAFHDFMRSTPMSPSMSQTSPLQQPPPPQFMPTAGPPRYGPPGHPSQGLRGPPPPRMQGQLQHGPPPGSYMAAASTRYAQHQGPPQLPPHQHHQHQQQQQHHHHHHHQQQQQQQQQSHLGFGPPPPNQMGSSPGAMNRMTPVGGPQQVMGQSGMSGPPPQPPPQMIGMAPGQQAPSPVNPMQCASGPPRNASQGSVGGWPPSQVGYGSVSSPAQQSMYSNGPGSNQPNSQGASGSGPMMMNDGNMIEVKSSPAIIGGDPSTPHSDEYVMPGPFGQDTSDQSESAEILKLKQSMQEDTTKMFEKEQSEFNLEYPDSQNKW